MKDRGIIFSAESIAALIAGKKTQTRRLVDEGRLYAHVLWTMRSDHYDALPPDLRVVAKAGRRRVTMNHHGAVTAVLPNDPRGLGLKPGEFNFGCPYADGQTILLPKDIRRARGWTIMPYQDQRLWVRETFELGTGGPNDRDVSVRYFADGATRTVRLTGEQRASLKRHHVVLSGKRRSPLLMPRWASRFVLDVKEVRLDRLQALQMDPKDGLADVLAEGFVGTKERWNETHRTVYGPYGSPPTNTLPWSAYANAWNKLHKDRPWDANPWVWVITFRMGENQ